ncbi:MAG: zinc ribbon domain-containing protein [Candidatus Neomarinimicrobiota bacterium]
MIITNKYKLKGKREFDYKLLFSEKIKQIDLELEEPLAAENFKYLGFEGDTSTNSKGQISYKTTIFDFLKSQSINLSFEYINNSGNTTKVELNKTLVSPQKNKKNLPNNRQKVNRYNLYTLETLLALFIVTFLIISILLLFYNRDSALKCTKCGHNLKVNDLFCSKCGEKR